MKKPLFALGLAFAILSASSYQASAEENDNIDEKTQQVLEDNGIELGTETYEEDGWEVEVTTKLTDIDEFKAQAGNNVISAPSTPTNGIMPLMEAEKVKPKKDVWSGAATINKNGLSGSVWADKITVSTIDVGPNSIAGDIMSYTKASGVTARPRLEVTTWGIMGGIQFSKDYKFTGSYSTGTVTKGINQSLTGIIGLYYIDLYGDFKKEKNTQTAHANLKKK